MTALRTSSGATFAEAKAQRQAMERGEMLDAETMKSVLLRHSPSQPLIVPRALFDIMGRVQSLEPYMARAKAADE